MSNFDDVKTFMQTFGQEVKIKTEFPKEKIAKLRVELDYILIEKIVMRAVLAVVGYTCLL